MQQVLQKAREGNKAVKITLRKKIEDQRKFTGRVVETSDTGFAIADHKSGNTRTFNYEGVQQVSQSGLSTGTIIVITALVADGLIILGVILHELGRTDLLKTGSRDQLPTPATRCPSWTKSMISG